MRGVVPLPVMLMETRCVMSNFASDGYDLSVEVTLLGYPMVRYAGRLRECTSEFLSAREAKAMGLRDGE